jgi:hypothetical protein
VRGATWAEIDLDAGLWVVPAEQPSGHRRVAVVILNLRRKPEPTGQSAKQGE